MMYLQIWPMFYFRIKQKDITKANIMDILVIL